MIHNPNSPWRKGGNHTKVTAETAELLAERINQLFDRGFELVRQYEEEPKHYADTVIIGNNNKRVFQGTSPKKYIAVMKFGGKK